MNVAIIPARGGSHRIPRKNVVDFHGRPIMSWSIQAASDSNLFESIIVSTDDNEIAAVARNAGAETPFERPSGLSGDRTPTVDVIAHAVEWLLQHDRKPEAVCCIYPTAPFIRSSDLAAGLAKLAVGTWDFVVAATLWPKVLRAFQQSETGGVQMLFPQHAGSRSQDLPPVWIDAGQFYWGTCEAWLNRREILGQGSTIVEIPAGRSLDIDTLDDLEIARAMWSPPAYGASHRD